MDRPPASDLIPPAGDVRHERCHACYRPMAAAVEGRWSGLGFCADADDCARAQADNARAADARRALGVREGVWGLGEDDDRVQS